MGVQKDGAGVGRLKREWDLIQQTMLDYRYLQLIGLRIIEG